MSGRDYTAARLRVAAVIGLMLVAAPSTPSLVTIDGPALRAVASSVRLPHLSIRISLEAPQ